MLKDSDLSESERVKLIVSRFFSKGIHVILESRHNYALKKIDSKEVTKDDKWFNLVLRELPSRIMRNNTDFCFSTRVVVDIFLLHRTQYNGYGKLSSVDLEPVRGSSDHWRRDGRGGKVIERWVMMFEGKKATGGLRGSSMFTKFYKKCLLMMRSLYVFVKLLPAYKLFRDLSGATEQTCEFCLGHHISSFAEPFTREEEAQMQKYSFHPVETSCGNLCVSVDYIASLVDLTIKPAYQISSRIIVPDYYGANSVESVCTAPVLDRNIMVTNEATSSRKLSLTIEKRNVMKTTSSANAQSLAAKAALLTFSSCSSHSLDFPSHTAKISRRDSLDSLRFKVPSELGSDPFQPKLSDNAALGTLLSILDSAAPLRQSTPAINPAKPTAKTVSEALRELQDHIEVKNTIIQRRPIGTPNIVAHSAVTNSSDRKDPTPAYV